MVGTLSGLGTERQSLDLGRIVHRVWTTMWTGCAPVGSLWNVACRPAVGPVFRVETSRRGGLGRPILGVVWGAMAPRVEVRRSARRRRTVTAFRERDTIVVLIPQRMSRADERVFVDDMVQRVLAREARARGARSDAELLARARQLAAELPGRRPRSGAGAQQRPLGGQPAAALGVVYAEHRRDPAVRPPAADAGLGGRLRPGARARPPGRADPLGAGSGSWSAAIRDAEKARGYLEGYLAGRSRQSGSGRCPRPTPTPSSTDLPGVGSRWCSRPTVPRQPRRRNRAGRLRSRLPRRRVRGARRPGRGAVRDRRSGLDRRAALAGCPAAAAADRHRASLRPALAGTSTTWWWSRPTSPTSPAWCWPRSSGSCPGSIWRSPRRRTASGAWPWGCRSRSRTGSRPTCWTSTAARSTGCGADRVPRSRWALVPGLAPAAHSGRPPIGSTPGWRAGRRLARSWPARRLPDGGLGSRVARWPTDSAAHAGNGATPLRARDAGDG